MSAARCICREASMAAQHGELQHGQLVLCQLLTWVIASGCCPAGTSLLHGCSQEQTGTKWVEDLALCYSISHGRFPFPASSGPGPPLLRGSVWAEGWKCSGFEGLIYFFFCLSVYLGSSLSQFIRYSHEHRSGSAGPCWRMQEARWAPPLGDADGRALGHTAACLYLRFQPSDFQDQLHAMKLSSRIWYFHFIAIHSQPLTKLKTT